MTESEFLDLKSGILQMLVDRLDTRLTYHCPGHTEDVLCQAERIALAENVTDARLLLLIKIAALFHDTGFLHTYKGHEKESCGIMIENVGKNLFDPYEINMIEGMIMATKVPQQPKTLPEMILCDADLDYLGRNDFEVISTRLRDELLAYGFIKEEKEWDQLQVNFFESHQYFTATSVRNRHPVKAEHLILLKQKILHPKS